WRTNLLRATPAKLRRRLRLLREARLIRKSHLFDASFYLDRNPDVKASGVDPIRHYLQWGAYEGRDPHPDFDTSFYVQNNPDVTTSGINPLVHYLARGMANGREIRAPQNISGLPVRGDISLPDPVPRIVYLSGCPGSPSHVYRVDHQVQALRAV